MAKIIFLDNIIYEDDDVLEAYQLIKREILKACNFIRYEILGTNVKSYEELENINSELWEKLEFIRLLSGDTDAYYEFKGPRERGITLFYHRNGALKHISILKIDIELTYDVTKRFDRKILRIEKEEPVDMEIMKKEF